MSERNGYDPGVPCWVDHSSPDPAAAATFYGDLLGWESEDQMPPGGPGRYFFAHLRGKGVAAMGSQQSPDAPPMWNTYVAVASADDAVAKVTEAGGTAYGEAFDVFGAGRMAVARRSGGGAVLRLAGRRAPRCRARHGRHDADAGLLARRGPAELDGLLRGRGQRRHRSQMRGARRRNLRTADRDPQGPVAVLSDPQGAMFSVIALTVPTA